MHNIAFPNLGLYFNINPIALSIGNVQIYWYGIIITLAILLGLLLSKLMDGKYGIKYNDVEEFVLWALPFSIIGARLYYVVFSWESYKVDPLSVFRIWEGGLAIYGGIIGAIVTAIIYCKVKRIKLFDLTDFCVPFLALGQSIGRWGNFINREAYGIETNSFFRMELLQRNGEYISVHPTFLYESFGLLIIFALLMLIRRKFSGEKTALYFLLYGLIRTGIEWLRADSLLVFNIKVSMVLSLILSFGALVFLIIKYITNKKINNLES